MLPIVPIRWLNKLEEYLFKIKKMNVQSQPQTQTRRAPITPPHLRRFSARPQIFTRPVTKNELNSYPKLEPEEEDGDDVKVVSTDSGASKSRQQSTHRHPNLNPNLNLNQDQTKTVEVISSSSLRTPEIGNCAGCGGQAKYRKVTDNFVCEVCRKRAPHQLVTRSTAIRHGATYEGLKTAHETGSIQMFTVPNFHAQGYYKPPPCHLYFLHEVKELVRERGQGTTTRWVNDSI